MQCRQPQGGRRTAEARGVKSCGHNASQADFAPKGFITGAELNWGTVYTEYAGLIATGQPLPNVNEGGYDKNMVSSTAFGAGATDAAIAAATAAIAETKASAPIFVGPIKDNTGKVVIEGTLGLYDGALWGYGLSGRGRHRLHYLIEDGTVDMETVPSKRLLFVISRQNCRFGIGHFPPFDGKYRTIKIRDQTSNKNRGRSRQRHPRKRDSPRDLRHPNAVARSFN